MELRDIEIFLVLAEELHFGRAAQRLHLSQARVSQAIKQQERRIGAPLFERTSRMVRLTPIGAQFRERLQPAYQQIVDGIEAIAAVARGISGVLTLGTMGAMARPISNVTDLFRARHPAVQLRFREIHPPDPFGPLRSGEVDVGLLWLPVREPDLTVGPVLRVTPVMAMVAETHPFAAHQTITLEDLAETVVVAAGGPIPRYVEAGLVPFETPSGRPIPRGTKVSTFQEVLTAVSAGQAIALTQAEAADYYPWPGIRYVLIEDAPPSQWALIWRTSAQTPVVSALAEAARDLGPHRVTIS